MTEISSSLNPVDALSKVPSPAELELRGAALVNRLEERLLLDNHFYYSGGDPPDHCLRKGPQRPPLPNQSGRRVAAGSSADRRAHAGRPCAWPGTHRRQRLLACRHRQCLHRGAEAVPRYSDPLRGGRIASGRGDGSDHSGYGRRPETLLASNTSSPGIAPVGELCTRSPIHSVTGVSQSAVGTTYTFAADEPH
jgi:hypothetical protein